jgi:hypothetical protein
MSQSSKLSINAPEQDYISKMVAIALLEQILKDEKINEDVTKQILEQFIKNMEDSLKNQDNIQNVPVTFPEMSHPSNIRLLRVCVPPHCGDSREVIE